MLSIRRLASALLVAAVLSAAERDPRAARKLLDGAVEMSAAVHPETGVAALMRAGMAYGALDRNAALTVLRRAFAALPTVGSEDLRDEYATAIVRAVAEIDVQAATEMLRQLPRPAAAAASVVRQLVSGKHIDEAMELLALSPEQSEYPYEAASFLMASLATDDSRRTVSFGRATAAYTRLPSGPFPVFVERFGRQLPSDVRSRAIAAMLLRIREWKDAGESFSGTVDGDDPNLEVHSPQQNELRELVSVVRLFDPAAVNAIVVQRPDIAAALAGFRKPRKAPEPLDTERERKEDDDPFAPPFGIGMADNMDGFRRGLEEYGKASKQAEKVSQALKKDPGEAVRLARELPDLIRAEAMAVIASSVVTRDTALATSVADMCAGEIERAGAPASRIPALVKLAGVYVTLKDRARAWAAYERALNDAAPLWAQDTKADRPNVASRDTWPSTQAVRMIAHEAGLQLGAAAEGLLSGISVADLALVARIQMARGLLGLPTDIHNINVRWVESDKR